MKDLDPGIKQSIGKLVPTPLPTSWLGLKTAPIVPPYWAVIPALTITHIRNLMAQIGYDASIWDYLKVSEDYRIGRYQFSPIVLEAYGLLAYGSREAYGDDCVNYVHCWDPVVNIKNGSAQPFQTYFYNANSLDGFLASIPAQEYLAYQRLVDLYFASVNLGVIKESDTAETIAGMIYVAWKMGVGSKPSANNATGTGAYAWRYFNVGNGVDPFNSGRYAISVLSAG